MRDIAIVIPCFNRTETLNGLLTSLLRAEYDRPVELVFSIDYSGDNHVSSLAEYFQWPFGKKTIIKHHENIGLRRNIIKCGDLTEQHDAVIVLEDDLVVSPLFFKYAAEACDYYWDEAKVAGISLYSYRFTEDSRAFYPEAKGYDTYFIQWTSSWGQLWTKKQWSDFKQWYTIHHDDLGDFCIPQYVKNWKKSWKKYNIAYVSDTDKYYVYPVSSFTTMVPSQGTHAESVRLRNRFIVPLCAYLSRPLAFQNIETAQKYDSFFEPSDGLLEIDGKEECVSYNIYCNKTKGEIKGKYYVTSVQIAGREPLKTWGRKLLPPEKNIMDSIDGDGLYLYKTQDYESASLSPEDKRRLNFDLSVAELLQLSSAQALRMVRKAFNHHLGRLFFRNRKLGENRQKATGVH